MTDVRYRSRIMAGFSLVELMVAVAISLFVLAAIITVLINSKKNYTIQDSTARLQENARFAMHFIAKDLRMAGYFGCADDITATYNHMNGSAGDIWNGTNALEGLDGDTSMTWYPSTTTAVPTNIVKATTYAVADAVPDAITIRYADGTGAISVVPPYMPTPARALHIGAGNGLQKGDIVVVTDCSSADVFQITGPAQGNVDNGTLNHNTGEAGVSPGNATGDLSKSYEGDASIAKLVAVRYFIGKNASQQPVLYRQALTLNDVGGTSTATTDAQELVEGIENLQVLYGKDTDGDRIPNVYLKAGQTGLTTADHWRNVVSVRIVFLAYSIASDTDTGEYAAGADAKNYDLALSGASADETPATTGNRRRRTFATTVMLRNIK